MKFKVGDRILITKTKWRDYRNGDVGTITHVESDNYLFTLNDGSTHTLHLDVDRAVLCESIDVIKILNKQI